MRHSNRKSMVLGLIVAVVLLLGLSEPAPATPTGMGPYAATAKDTTLSALMTRWAALEGKQLVWQADADAHIKNPDAINTLARLGNVASFEQGLRRLNGLIENLPAASTPAGADAVDPEGYQACLFKDTVVVLNLHQRLQPGTCTPAG